MHPAPLRKWVPDVFYTDEVRAMPSESLSLSRTSCRKAPYQSRQYRLYGGVGAQNTGQQACENGSPPPFRDVVVAQGERRGAAGS